MIKIYELLNAINRVQNIEFNNTSISNYDQNTEKTISEDEYLTKIYKDLISIRKVLINYISAKESENKR